MHKNNFDIIRLIAATIVIISHEFSFFSLPEPLFELTSQVSLGTFGVYIFFTISGYLITKSYLRMPNPKDYLINRLLRIYPGLIAVVIITIFVFGPILTDLPIKEYFSKNETYLYLWNISLMKLSFYLPGVLPYDEGQKIINPPLWTLVFEFAMYVLVIFFAAINIYKTKLFNAILISFVIIAIIACSMGIPKNLFFIGFNVKSFTSFFAYFFTGSLFYVNQHRFKLRAYQLALILIIWYLSINTILFYFLNLLFVIYGTFYFGLYAKPFLNRITSNRDLSYGFYIYGFLVQHIIFEITGTSLGLFWSIVLCIIGVIPFSLFSWHLIESNALKFKRRNIANKT